jgi:hypothetical protein
MKRRQAIWITLALAGLAGLFVLSAIGDGIYWDTAVPAGKGLRAALAIRDNVTPFQKWGSEVFTLRYLKRYYGGAWYFTQSKKGDLEQEITSCLDDALEHYLYVDLYLLAHANEYIQWVARLPEERRRRLRLVYNTGCHNQTQGPKWLELGAKAYVGHPGESWSSVFYYFFLRHWTRRGTVQEAMDASNRRTETTLKEWEVVTFGHWQAASLMKGSLASCYGDAQLRLEGQAP